MNTSSWRQIPDISFDADPASGVAVLDTTTTAVPLPWIQVGGTSVSSPCWAGLIAIGDQLRDFGRVDADGRADADAALALRMKAADFHDIISGSNGGFSAHAGYDVVTGIGSPIANKLVPDFVPVAPKGTVSFLDPRLRDRHVRDDHRQRPRPGRESVLPGDADLQRRRQRDRVAARPGRRRLSRVDCHRGRCRRRPATASCKRSPAERSPSPTTTPTTARAIPPWSPTRRRCSAWTITRSPPISGPKTAGVGFSVTVTAYDTSNNPISGYNGTATLTGRARAARCRSVPRRSTFVSGVWTGNVTVNAVDPTVTLHVANGTGAAGTSNTFATQAGPVASFQYSTIPSPEYQNVAFPVTLTAKDANGYTATGFNGTVNLSGQTGPGAVTRRRRHVNLDVSSPHVLSGRPHAGDLSGFRSGRTRTDHFAGLGRVNRAGAR